MSEKLTKAERKRKYGKRWAKWKRAQRAKPSKNAHESRYTVRHHTGKGNKVVKMSRSRHAKAHWKRNDGSAGGKGKKKR